MATTLAEIVKARSCLVSENTKRVSEDKEWRTAFDADIEALAARESLLVAGLDLAKIDTGRSVIDILGKTNGALGRTNMVNDAKVDIAAEAKVMRSRYFGIKNYDRFGDQREDHEYGHSPRHGHIVFKIGLTTDMLSKIKAGHLLTAEETNGALYLLAALPKIEASQ